MSALKQWLRKSPVPSKVRITCIEDGERVQREVALSNDVRGKWKTAEETIVAARAVEVECLGSDGELLRARKLTYEDDDDAAAGITTTPEEKRVETMVGKERRELGYVLDMFGKRINEAYKLGSEATLASHEQVLAMADTMLAQWAAAMQSLHNVSTKLGEILSEDDNDKGKADVAFKAFLGKVIANKLGGEDEEKGSTKPNGKGKARDG
jgi:hypothetical protein